MKIKEILKKQIEKIKPDEKGFKDLEKKTNELIDKLGKEIKKRKIKADVFLGGSLAKKTILRKDNYDIDIFVRFDKKYKDDEISDLLARVVKGTRIHGSRDYFQVKQGKITFEVIPVIKILKAKEARNVTDLSYFHVSYVKNNIKKNPRLANEILLAKLFCYANNAYGAESYIKGFSGYALELLIIYYKGFLNFIKAINKAKEQIILDPEKHYKNRQEILLQLNEAKLASPIVFVDPTFKERNTLAALSKETFEKFKIICKNFLKKPSTAFFEEKRIDRKNYNLILEVRTNKQEGDIAGSKLKKFFGFLDFELGKYFEVDGKDFEYDGKKKANLYFKIKAKKEIILTGPPINDVENVLSFRKKHKNVFIKNSRVYAKEKINLTASGFVNKFKKDNKKRMKEMGIISLK